MTMRITNQLMADTNIANIADSLDRLYKLQQKAATGKKYARASENPAVTTQNMALRSTITHIEVYQSTMSSTRTWQEMTDTSLQQMVTIQKKVQTLIIKGLDDTQGPDERSVMGNELAGLVEQSLSVLNAQDRDRYIFSGLKTDTKPFTLISQSNLIELGLDTNPAAVDAVKVKDIKSNMPVIHEGANTIRMGGIQVLTDPAEPLNITVNGNQISFFRPGDGSPPYFRVNSTTNIYPENPSSPEITVDGFRIQVDDLGNPTMPYTVEGVNIDPAAPPPPFGGVAVTVTPGSPPVFSTGDPTVPPDPNARMVYGVRVAVENPTDPFPTFVVGGNRIVTPTGPDPTFVKLKNVNVSIDPTLPNVYPAYYRDRVMYSGDDNVMLREIAPNESMVVNVNGGEAFGKTIVTDPADPVTGEKVKISTMFDNMILMRDILNAEDYTRPHALVPDGMGGLKYVLLDQPDTTPAYPERTYLETEYRTQQTWLNSVSTVASDNGARMKNLSDSFDRADKAILEIKSLLSQNEDVNMAEAISEVLNQEKIYQTVLNITGRTNTALSLFDTLQ
ncbi:MAG: hypothetical protein HPY45_01505 [Anaerolineae bacterium]|nr:hypothetical protein [Anaerolineae bacterium]